jgi:hypothetical protein
LSNEIRTFERYIDNYLPVRVLLYVREVMQKCVCKTKKDLRAYTRFEKERLLELHQGILQDERQLYKNKETAEMIQEIVDKVK